MDSPRYKQVALAAMAEEFVEPLREQEELVATNNEEKTRFLT
jgi:hypothetical protein